MPSESGRFVTTSKPSSVLRDAVLEDLERLLREARDRPALREDRRVELDGPDVLLREVLRRVVVAHVLGRRAVLERRDDAQEPEVGASRDVDDLLEGLLEERRRGPVVHEELDLFETLRLGHGEVRDDAHGALERGPLRGAQEPDAEGLAPLVQDHLVLSDRLSVLCVADHLDDVLARKLAEIEVRREGRAPLRDHARVVQVELGEGDLVRGRPGLEPDEARRDLARDREDREAPFGEPWFSTSSVTAFRAASRAAFSAAVIAASGMSGILELLADESGGVAVRVLDLHRGGTRRGRGRARS